MNCPNCHKELSDDIRFCPYCGGSLINTNQPEQDGDMGNTDTQPNGAVPPPQLYCEHCGALLKAGQLYCSDCGCSTQSSGQNFTPNAPAKRKSKLAAGLMGIFLGALGIHNFYLGYYSKAVVQLLLTLIGVPLCCIVIGFFMMTVASVWGLVEGVLILSGQISTDGNGLPLWN